MRRKIIAIQYGCLGGDTHNYIVATGGVMMTNSQALSTELPVPTYCTGPGFFSHTMLRSFFLPETPR